MNSCPGILAVMLIFTCFGACKWEESGKPGLSGEQSDLSQEFPLLGEALERLNYSAAQVQSGVMHILPVFPLLYDDALQLPGFGQRFGEALIGDCRRPDALLYHIFRMLGAPAGGYGPPLSGTWIPDPVLPVLQDQEKAMLKLKSSCGFRFVSDDRGDWEKLTPGLRSRILEAVAAFEKADLLMQQYTAPLVKEFEESCQSLPKEYRDWLMEPWKNRQMEEFSSLDILERSDMRKLSCASRLLVSSLRPFGDMKVEEEELDFDSCLIETNMGRVGIFGSGKDTISGDFSLLIDLGGDDYYQGRIASPPDSDQVLSVVIDLGGDDTYAAGTSCLVNACLGLGLLMDLSGNDTYQTGQAGLASACYGMAMLLDYRGDDSYISHSPWSQGAAHSGAAILADLDGSDRYQADDFSQGYGGTQGVGILLDMAGDDRYNEGQDYPSFVQGSARGRWAEATDGHSLGGGLGMLVDAGGSDRYCAESFSQGAAYFMGIGFLMDRSGEDHYQSISHSQGFAAHYALSSFLELSGDDHYNEGSDMSIITQIIGGGRDLSFGCFIESEGDDIYHFGNRSAGIGDINGIGLLWDQAGKDQYSWHQNMVNAGSISLGHTPSFPAGMAFSPRMFDGPRGPRLGEFCDEGGKKIYILEDLEK